ncbi:MAG: helix-turn-helix transcriptional regulator [Nocardioides sp.]
MSEQLAGGIAIPHSNDELLTLEEVAALVRVPVATVRYWRARGNGPRGFKVGRTVRYWRTEVVLWLDAQANCSQPGE